MKCKNLEHLGDSCPIAHVMQVWKDKNTLGQSNTCFPPTPKNIVPKATYSHDQHNIISTQYPTPCTGCFADFY